MKRDTLFKDLLLQATPQASDAFTAAVMNRIAASAATRQPLVPTRLKHIFLLTFLGFGLLACGLAVSMGLPALSFPAIEASFLTGEMLKNILAFFVVFWTLVGVNGLLERKHYFSWQV